MIVPREALPSIVLTLRQDTPVALLYNSLLESILLPWTVQVYLIPSLQGKKERLEKSKDCPSRPKTVYVGSSI